MVLRALKNSVGAGHFALDFEKVKNFSPNNVLFNGQ